MPVFIHNLIQKLKYRNIRGTGFNKNIYHMTNVSYQPAKLGDTIYGEFALEIKGALQGEPALHQYV